MLNLLKKRRLYNDLLKWKVNKERKPLVLQGARQVGKTHLLKQFAEKEFVAFHYFNFEEDKRLAVLFETNLDPTGIMEELAILSGRSLLAGHCLVFDEIQACPRALTSLKYFHEKKPEQALLAAGSLLGISLSGESFPVGQVDFLNLYPLTFEEFLMACGDQICLDILTKALQTSSMPQAGHARLLDRLKEYYVTGGMPEVVSRYLSFDNADPVQRFAETRKVQKGLLESYYKDFAKHSGKINAMHIANVFENIPLQLSRNMDGSVRRFLFRGVLANKKSYADLENPITWLEKANLVLKTKICNRAEIPLESFCKHNIFKLYLFDIGLLGCMLQLPLEALRFQDYGIAKGYFAENFVAQELVAQERLASWDNKLYAWNEETAEIEFLRWEECGIVPIEVKSGLRTQAKSLKQYLLKYKPKKSIKLSLQRLQKPQDDGSTTMMPLYMAGWL